MVHRTALKGYQDSVATYVRGRPGYPPETADWLHDDLALGTGKTVLEVGAGTGKFLPLLLATGAKVIALEPVAAMRAEIGERYGIATLDGAANAIPLPAESIDAIVCAQAFHWFATAESLAEMRRVLKPGGVLGLIWNGKDVGVPWVADMARIIDAYQGDVPRYQSGRWRDVFPATGFTALEERRVANRHDGPPEDVIVARALSTSFIAALPKAEQANVAARLRALIAATPDLASRDEVGVPYETLMVAFRKI